MRGHFGSRYFGPVDYVGLYWHLVDMIWIYLFPLLVPDSLDRDETNHVIRRRSRSVVRTDRGARPRRAAAGAAWPCSPCCWR